MARPRVPVCLCGLSLTGLIATTALCSHADPLDGIKSRATHHRVARCITDPSSSGSTLPRPPRPHPVDGEAQPPTDHPTVPPTVKPDPPVQPTTGPSSIDRTAVRRGARQFRTYLDQGHVRLLNEQRDRAQIEGLCLEGLFQWPPPLVQPRPDRLGPESDPLDSSNRTAPSRHEQRGPTVRTVSDQPPDASAPDSDRRQSSDSSSPGIVKAQPISYTTGPPVELFQMLNALASHATDRQPLAITSLLRPPYRTVRYYMQSATNPHALGIAVDIAAYGGHTISSADPEEDVQAFIAILKALGPGRYRMGLPKAPQPTRALDTGFRPPDSLSGDSPQMDSFGSALSRRSEGALPSRGARRQDGDREPGAGSTAATRRPADDPTTPTVAEWPFFPPPQKTVDAQGKSTILFANEHYAAEQYLSDPRLRKALSDARQRGADVFALFPDGADHIHIDVRQVP